MLFELIEKVNVSAEKHFGGVLFKKLADGDSQLKSAFIKPSNNSIVQYQNFLMQLNKLTIERINTKMFSENVDPSKLMQEKNKAFGSRIQFAIFLQEKGFRNYKEMDAVFKLISNSRNKLAGHSASIPQYNKVWGRSEEKRLDTKKDSEYLLSELNKNLEALIRQIGE